jgi:hypothetical protein
MAAAPNPLERIQLALFDLSEIELQLDLVDETLSADVSPD